LAFFLASLFIFFGETPSTFAAVKTEKVQQAVTLTAEQQYEAAKEYARRLETTVLWPKIEAIGLMAPAIFEKSI
jgi:hypothetical protein